MEGSEASTGRLGRGKHAEHIVVLTHVNGTWPNSHGDHSWMANLSVEEPDALMRARPDLWELWGSNAPEPPGPEHRAHVRWKVCRKC